MTENKKLLSAAETATILRQHLGPARAWRDFLADCIRERSQLHGLVLLPYAARDGGRRLVPRPLYRAADVVEFIRAVRSANPSLRAAPIAAEVFEVTTAPGLPWRLRIARPSKPAAASL
jgi:hypothetical protein